MHIDWWTFLFYLSLSSSLCTIHSDFVLFRSRFRHCNHFAEREKFQACFFLGNLYSKCKMLRNENSDVLWTVSSIEFNNSELFEQSIHEIVLRKSWIKQQKLKLPMLFLVHWTFLFIFRVKTSLFQMSFMECCSTNRNIWLGKYFHTSLLAYFYDESLS